MTRAVDGEWLGEVVSEHPVEARRALTGGVCSLAFALLCGGTGLALAPGRLGGTGADRIPLVLLGLGLIGLTQAAWVLREYARQRGTLFRVHRGGLAHRRNGVERTYPWRDMTVVRHRLAGGFTARAMGRDVRCLIRLPDGGTVRLAGFTHRAHHLATEIDRASRACGPAA
ncbi:hypothetical protein GCM10009801_71420 [Streptomyces albiaxialis]|uniref:PH domain-containing protein n=1 Tax=Streptomyces albiaxialis TaxID=329523 RepID=A0ABN2WWF9_9ACTN